MNPFRYLDEHYLDFRDRTGFIFNQYPQLEPLRHFIFKELLVQRRLMGWDGFFKHWLRPLVRRGRTRGPLIRADVLIWIESSREVIVEALLPVYRELVSRGIKTQLVSYGGPDTLPPSTLHFQFPAQVAIPDWAKQAWGAICDVFEELARKQLAWSFYCACSNIQGLFDELDRILEVIKPSVVLNASTQLVGGAGLVVASRSHGALTLLLQHGIVQPFYTPLLADHMLTWGRSSDEILIRLGVPHQQLIALGSPRHDAMRPSPERGGKASLLGTLSLSEKPTFVFFSNGNDLVRNGSAPLECAKWLETTAAQYSDDMNIIVRLHPNEDGSIYQNYPHLRITKESPDLATTLEGCDWVGSLCSTVLYDALLYKKPVWQFYANGWPDLAQNWKYGLAVRISSQAELSEMVNHMLNDGIQSFVDRKIIDRVFANHGRAAEAAANFVKSRLEREDKGSQDLDGRSTGEMVATLM